MVIQYRHMVVIDYVDDGLLYILFTQCMGKLFFHFVNMPMQYTEIKL